MPERYLITGGAGNLACQLTFDLARDGNEVFLADIADKPAAAVAPGCTYLRGDITKREDVLAAFDAARPTIVLHFASLLSGSCERDRELAWRVNMDAAFSLFETALARNVGKFFFPSSLATYGGTLASPLPEDQPQWPSSLYGVTKVACERLGLYYAEKHGLDFRCIRLPVVISAHAPAGAASAYASRAFVEAVESRAFKFKVYRDTQTSAVYVRDVLDGIVALLAAPQAKLTQRVYNIHGLTINANAIADAISTRVPGVEFQYESEAAIADLIAAWPAVIDDATARRDWGWSPKFDLSRLADHLLGELQTAGSASS